MKQVFASLMFCGAAVFTVCTTADSFKSGSAPAAAEAGKTAAPTPSGQQLFLVCEGCHSIAPGAAHKVGPNLHGIMGQPAASRSGYDYSSVLKQSKIVWNRNTLLGFIWFTEGMAPGTWMLYHNQLTADEAGRLVDYIETATQTE